MARVTLLAALALFCAVIVGCGSKPAEPKSSQTLFAYPQDAARLQVQVRGTDETNGGRLVSTQGAINVLVRGGEPPNWIFLGDLQSPEPTKGIPIPDSTWKRVTLEVTAKSSLPAVIKLGFSVVPASASRERSIHYSSRLNVTNEFTTYRDSIDIAFPGAVYVMPLIRAYPPAEYNLEIRSFSLTAGKAEPKSTGV
jgi:hypothetical protein